MSSALIGVIQQWLNTEHPESPKDMACTNSIQSSYFAAGLKKQQADQGSDNQTTLLTEKNGVYSFLIKSPIGPSYVFVSEQYSVLKYGIN